MAIRSGKERRSLAGIVVAAITAAAVLPSGVAHAENAVSVGAYGADGTYVAVAPAGNANSSSGVAISGTGTANGALGAVSGTQTASSGGIAASVLGHASGGIAGISAAADGTGGIVGASLIGNSAGGILAINGIGETQASSPYEASAYGFGFPDPTETESFMIMAAKGLLKSVPGAPSPGLTCVGGVVWVDLRPDRPETGVGCVGGVGMSVDGQECDACTGWNGLKWANKGERRDVSVYYNHNTAEETVDRQNSHGALLRTIKRYRGCSHDDELADMLWSGFSGDINHQYRSPELRSPTKTGENQSFQNAAGHKWWDGGNYWVIEDTQTDMCLHFNQHK